MGDDSDSDSESDYDLDEDEDGRREMEEDEERDLDLMRQEEHEADNRLIGVYDDTIHRNDGRHLRGGIADDAAMQMLYDKVVSYPHPLYSPPKGKIGNDFLALFFRELRMVREWDSNSERAMMFPACILRREANIVKAKEIRRRIKRRMELWQDGKVAELAEDVVNTARRGGGRGSGGGYLCFPHNQCLFQLFHLTFECRYLMCDIVC